LRLPDPKSGASASSATFAQSTSGSTAPCDEGPRTGNSLA